MDSNTHSDLQPVGPPDPDHDGQVVDLHALAAEDLDQLADPALSQQVAQLQRQWNALGGQWLRRLAALDARGAAGAEQDLPAPSTAGWLRRRLHMSATVAHCTVRTARALFRGPLPQTAQALLGGDISPAHAQAVVEGTEHLPDQVVSAAEPVLLEAARRLDPPQLRRLVGHLVQVADPDGADRARDRRHDQRGLWLSPTFDGLVAVKGLLEPEAGNIVQAALEPLARPKDAGDDRKGSQRTADALTELARRALEGGRLPKAGGVRPQLLVTIDLDSLLGRPGAVGGDTGWAGSLGPETCRRLACDAAVSRVVISRQPTGQQPQGDTADQGPAACDCDPSGHGLLAGDHPHGPAGLQAQLRAAMALLPPVLGGAPALPLDVGRATRVVQPAQRSALAVRDRGCVFPGCDRPLAWCDGHHLISWLDGGPTDLSNLALLCRAHPGPSMRAAGASPADPTASSRPPHPSEDTGVPPDGTRRGSAPGHRAGCVDGRERP